MRSKLMILCLAVIAIIIGAASAWSQDFFKGKAIQIIMGYPTGGGVDAEARLLAKYLERYLPGNPAVTVRNMPGAAGLVAANWFEQFGKPDRRTSWPQPIQRRSEEHTSELQSRPQLVCRLLLAKNKT